MLAFFNIAMLLLPSISYMYISTFYSISVSALCSIEKIQRMYLIVEVMYPQNRTMKTEFLETIGQAFDLLVSVS